MELIRKCGIHESRDRGAEVMVVVRDSVTTVMTVKNVTLTCDCRCDNSDNCDTHVMAAAMGLCDSVTGIASAESTPLSGLIRQYRCSKPQQVCSNLAASVVLNGDLLQVGNRQSVSDE